MNKEIISYHQFIHPKRLYGNEQAKTFFGTAAKDTLVQVGETVKGIVNPLSCIKKDAKLKLHLEKRSTEGGRSQYWLKFWQSTYNFTGVWQVLENSPHLACGQFSRMEVMGKKHPVVNPLKPFSSVGLLIIFNDLPELATAMEIVIFQDGRDYVKKRGIRSLASGIMDAELCELRSNLAPSFDYGIDLHSMLKLAYKDGRCLPPSMTLFDAA